MTPIAPHITAFLQKHMATDRGASSNTCDSYAYAFQLLFEFAAERLGKEPSSLFFEEIDADLIVDFLRHLEDSRGNSPASRNIRLAAIKSFMRFMQYRLPSALEQLGKILAIPNKRTVSRIVAHLPEDEMQAILDAPDPSTRSGIRDRAMLHLCFCAGLRVSELINIGLHDLTLRGEPSALIHGKGRMERVLPLWRSTAQVLRAWLEQRGEAHACELFINAKGEAMTRAGFEYILQKHARKAALKFPDLLQRQVSPHVLRHSCAMMILKSTKDIRKVSLWLGHSSIQTTEIYLRSDTTENVETINLITPPKLRTGRFHATDKLLAQLKSSLLCGAKKTLPRAKIKS